MSDRELLELAAKAAGVAVQKQSPWGGFDDRLGLYELASDGSHVISKWNPLEDDGDALRLAVKLGIKASYERNAPPELGIPRECAIAVLNGKYYSESNNRDPESAMRRAIVRAAAEIGRRL